MKNENIKTRVLQVIAVILAALGVVSCLQPFMSPASNVWLKLTSGCGAAAQVYIAIYSICGFRKKSAIFLKVFVNLATLSVFFCIIEKCKHVSLTLTAISLVSFAALVALTVNEDFDNIKFGKTKSLIACAIFFAECVINFVTALINCPGVYRGGDMLGSLLAISTGEKILLSLTLFVAIYAKYKDREKRKTAL